MSPARRRQGYRTYGRAADTYDAVAWRAPSAKRFDVRPANDSLWSSSADHDHAGSELPRWLIILAGAVIAALIGAMLGGMLAV